MGRVQNLYTTYVDCSRVARKNMKAFFSGEVQYRTPIISKKKEETRMRAQPEFLTVGKIIMALEFLFFLPFVAHLICIY